MVLEQSQSQPPTETPFNHYQQFMLSTTSSTQGLKLRTSDEVFS